MAICFIVLFSILFLNIFLFGPRNKCLLLTSRLFDTKSKTAAKKVDLFFQRLLPYQQFLFRFDCCYGK